MGSGGATRSLWMEFQDVGCCTTVPGRGCNGPELAGRQWATRPSTRTLGRSKMTVNVARRRCTHVVRQWAVHSVVSHSCESVFVANASTDSSSNIKARREEGLHVVRTAGIRNLDMFFLQVNQSNRVIPGLKRHSRLRDW